MKLINTVDSTRTPFVAHIMTIGRISRLSKVEWNWDMDKWSYRNRRKSPACVWLGSNNRPIKIE